MTIKHLRIFIAVCEYGSTTKASEALFIVQPTVSHTITELERFYKVRLFDRVNQRLVLTEVGRELLIKAKGIVAEFEDFEAIATSGGQSTCVKIGSSLTLGQTVIPKLLQYIEREGLVIEPPVMIRSAGAIERELEQGNLDFGIVSDIVSSPYLISTPLAQDRFVFVANYGLELPEELTLAELCEYPLFLREEGSSTRSFLEGVMAEYGIKVKPRIDSSNNQALVSALYMSNGIAFLPYSYVSGHIKRKKLKEVKVRDFTANRANYLVIHKNKKLNAFQQLAYDIIKTL